ncbi:hypothetical protein FVEG_15102 [Fusarium verticillioides 7600]|uniref:Uncharacterized protein n=1 Tax=Gibberella moniliformis (strain M3125 / FGSC 7600) TaxID=334819 RepID=W7LXB9_GIBM7|nr:hypothetical protein FVEG_15102 [Fusarium verticillioides 7600]EWG40044.1 hypothetical protein FVEG_15102 [Fusarium verticillioides 7600]
MGRYLMLEQKLKNGTFIIPRTGERSRSEFSLSTSTNAVVADDVNKKPKYQSFEAAESFGDRVHIVAHNVKTAFILVWLWLHTEEGHGVLKCTLAYPFLATEMESMSLLPLPFTFTQHEPLALCLRQLL